MHNCGCPGSGKSRLLDEIAALPANTEQLAAIVASVNNVPQQLLGLIRDWVPVLVSFNGDTQPEPFDKENTMSGLVLRILFS